MKNIISHSTAALFQLYLFFMTIDKLVYVPKENITKKIILLLIGCTWFLAFLIFAYETYKEIKLKKHKIFKND
jgi:hypothetical protein